MYSVPVSPTFHTEGVSASRPIGDGRAYTSPIWLAFVPSSVQTLCRSTPVTTLSRTLSRVSHAVTAGHLGPRRPLRRRVDRSGVAVHPLPSVRAAMANSRGSITCVACQEIIEPLLTVTTSRAYLPPILRQLLPVPGRVQRLRDRGSRAVSFREPAFYTRREVRRPKRQEVACIGTRHRDSRSSHAQGPWSVFENTALLRLSRVLDLYTVVPSREIDPCLCDVISGSAALLTGKRRSAIELDSTQCSHDHGPDSAGWEQPTLRYHAVATVRPQWRRLRAYHVGCLPATAVGSPRGRRGEVASLDSPLALAPTYRNVALPRVWSRLRALGTEPCGRLSVPTTDAAPRRARPVPSSKVLIRREAIERWSVRNRSITLDHPVRHQSTYSQTTQSCQTRRCSRLLTHRDYSEYPGRQLAGTKPKLGNVSRLPNGGIISAQWLSTGQRAVMPHRCMLLSACIDMLDSSSTT